MLINGAPDQQLSPSDRGLQYGDGLFETIAVRAGEPMLWERHLARLHLGEQRLGIPAQADDLLYREALSLSGAQDGVLKIIITRGQGGRGYRPPASPQPTRLISFHAWPEPPDLSATGGIAMRICSTRLGHNPALAGMKHLNRLEQVLARQEWSDPQIYDCVMLDTQDHVICGAQSNLFLIKTDRLYTPDLKLCGIAGIVRGLVLEQAESLAIGCEITSVSLESLHQADGVFITSSLLGICPVATIGKSAYDPQIIPTELIDRVNTLALGEARRYMPVATDSTS